MLILCVTEKQQHTSLSYGIFFSHNILLKHFNTQAQKAGRIQFLFVFSHLSSSAYFNIPLQHFNTREQIVQKAERIQFLFFLIVFEFICLFEMRSMSVLFSVLAS